MSFPPPSASGCASVQWVNGNELHLRTFYVGPRKNLIMASFDNPDLSNPSNNPRWQFSEPKINEKRITGLAMDSGHPITAVSVFPNTDQHEIHVFYSKNHITQSAIFSVGADSWSLDVVLPTLGVSGCPSSAIGWEDGSQNAFRLYYCTGTDSEVTTREIVYQNGDWTDNETPLDSFLVEGAGGDGAVPKTAALTWLDGSNVQQVRVYHFEQNSVRELVYVNSTQEWVVGELYGNDYLSTGPYVSAPIVAIPIVSRTGQYGIRHYGYQQSDGQQLTWNELAWDTSSQKWATKLLPFSLESIDVNSTEEISIQFSAISWNWPQAEDVFIRLHRVAFMELKPENPYIIESAYDGIPLSEWTEQSARF